jgi:hypothetical protein
VNSQVITLVATVIGIVLGMATLGGLFSRRLGPVVELGKQLHGEDGDDRRGIAPRPGILERQTATEREAAVTRAELAEARAELVEMRAMLREVVAAVRNNGGSSLKDIAEKTLQAVTTGNTAAQAARQEVRA